MAAVVRHRGPSRAGIQGALTSHAVYIIHEDGQCRVGTIRGRHGGCPGQAQLTAYNLGIDLDAPEVIADSAPLAIEVDLNPTRYCVGAADQPNGDLG